jgi:hypothetical protein
VVRERIGARGVSEREIEHLREKLRDAESLVLEAINNSARKAQYNALEDCKLAIWKAMDKAADIARIEVSA